MQFYWIQLYLKAYLWHIFSWIYILLHECCEASDAENLGRDFQKKMALNLYGNFLGKQNYSPKILNYLYFTEPENSFSL